MGRPALPWRDAAAALAAGQGAYFVLTGVWPLLSMRTFEAVTGPKRDRWLVRTVGVLVAVIGTALLLGGRRRRVGPEERRLAGASAAGLGAVDVVYAARGTISKVYLLDALVEAALAAAWLFLSARPARATPAPAPRRSPGGSPGRTRSG
jgi:hypothetical protein